MHHVLFMRYFRIRHRISLTDLSKASGISHQHISRIELLVERPSQRTMEAIAQGFEQIIVDRNKMNELLAAEYSAAKGRLFVSY